LAFFSKELRDSAEKPLAPKNTIFIITRREGSDEGFK
jgi:hypothetical protein